MLKRVLIAMPVIALLVIAFIYALSSHSLPIRPLTTEELLDIRAKYDMKTHEYIISKYPERIDDGGNIIWETEAIKETAKLENVTKLSAVKKLAERQ